MSKLAAFAICAPAVLLPVMVFPLIQSWIKLPRWDKEGHEPAHAVEYFAWVNLKGAVASAVTGVLVYLLVIRRLLTTIPASWTYGFLWRGKSLFSAPNLSALV